MLNISSVDWQRSSEAPGENTNNYKRLSKLFYEENITGLYKIPRSISLYCVHYECMYRKKSLYKEIKKVQKPPEWSLGIQSQNAQWSMPACIHKKKTSKTSVN